MSCLQLLHVFIISNQLNLWNQVKYSPLTSHLQVIPILSSINTHLCLLNGKGEYQRLQKWPRGDNFRNFFWGSCYSRDAMGKWFHLRIGINAALRDRDRLERVLAEMLQWVKVDWSKLVHKKFF